MVIAQIEQRRIAVLIPCHDEALTVGSVIEQFRRVLPQASIVVFDNCSRDDTAAVARRHGATVIFEPRKGKGFVIESMFATIDADFFVMIDGDDTYPVDHVDKLLAPVIAGEADMVVGARLAQAGDHAFRPLHVAGNRLVVGLINRLFSTQLSDVLSGFRAFNRRVIEQTPIVSSGFEVETEMTIQLLYNRMTIREVEIPYRSRPPGSKSKLNTFRDGFIVLWKLFSLFRAIKPLTFFGVMAIALFVLSILAGIPPIHDYLTNPDHFVHHVPLAILAAAMMILSFSCGFLGILLHAINWRFKELHNVLVRRHRR